MIGWDTVVLEPPINESATGDILCLSKAARARFLFFKCSRAREPNLQVCILTMRDKQKNKIKQNDIKIRIPIKGLLTKMHTTLKCKVKEGCRFYV